MGLPKLIAVVGTNASGKSAVGIGLAKAFGGEIISADSRQVYRGFDLCSGKVTREERDAVPHHLLDIRDVGEPFSVADFQGLAYRIAPEIARRGKVPFIVGGTGLYTDSVIHGYTLRGEASPDPELRARLEGLPLEELLAKLTPEGRAFLSARPAELSNKRRVVRVLEKAARGEPPAYRNDPAFEVLRLGVTWPKEILHKRIGDRLRERVARGMVGEVRQYLDGGGNPDHLYNLGLEYRYILWYVAGKFKSPGEFHDELGGAIKRFAKRQLTWYKRDKSIRWLDMEADPLEQAAGETAAFLGRDNPLDKAAKAAVRE